MFLRKKLPFILSPNCINKDIKQPFHKRNQTYMSYLQNKSNIFFFHQFKFLGSKLNSLIKKSILNYFTCLSKRLSVLITSLKSYWSISNKKTLFIPPLLHSNQFITRTEIFFFFFYKSMFS